jgi:RNA-directed DNA polymerase
VLDEWIEKMIRPLLKGKVLIIRYADDYIIGFKNEEDAQRVSRILPKRMQKLLIDHSPLKEPVNKIFA